MKRILAFSALVLFVTGILLLPAFHHAHLACSDSEHSESHNPETCAICVVVATALVAACVHVAVAAMRQPATVVRLSDLLVLDLFIPQSHLARAPPAA